ncbi:MAG: hypothetical protein IJU84_07675 [Clostridia bacterium]|nr:hypothetical protein [Clostridia bacterium]
MEREQMVKLLSAKRAKKRLKGVKLLKKAEADDRALIPETKEGKGNLSLHSFYSFSPYSPSQAAYTAYKSGLEFAGLTDHDTLSGAAEFVKACNILGMECTVGLQLRARFYEGKGRWLNSFYEKDVGFVTIRGIPSGEINALDKEIAAVRADRAARDRQMVEKFNARIKKYGISINFDKDVKPLSRYAEGGTITERHILYAFAEKLIQKFGSAEAILSFIKDALKIQVEEEYCIALSDIRSDYYAYDLVNCLKHEIRFFYIPADDLPSARSVAELAHRHGALACYSYVGETRRVYDGEETVIELEQGYLDELMKDLGETGFDAVEYSPVALTAETAERLTLLAKENGMFTLPSSDVNSPRHRMISDVGLPEELACNSRAVIGHEKSASYDISDGINTDKSKEKNPELGARLRLYSEIGKLRLRK